MAANLLEIFHQTLSDTIITQASSIMGESAESTNIALKSTAAVLLGSLLHKSQTDAGARALMDYFSENRIDGNNLTRINSLLEGGHETEQLVSSGADQLKYLLGDQLSRVIDSIAGSSGLKTSSASYLLKLVSPLLLGVVGKYIREKSLDGFGLKSLLQMQREYVVASLPRGMEEIPGLEMNAKAGQINTLHPTVSSTLPEEKSTLSKLLPWMVLLLTSLGLFYLVEKGCGATEKPDEKIQTESPVDTLK